MSGSLLFVGRWSRDGQIADASITGSSAGNDLTTTRERPFRECRTFVDRAALGTRSVCTKRSARWWYVLRNTFFFFFASFFLLGFLFLERRCKITAFKTKGTEINFRFCRKSCFFQNIPYLPRGKPEGSGGIGSRIKTACR